MEISFDTIKTWVIILGSCAAALTAILMFFKNLRDAWNHTVGPLWHKVIKHLLKAVIASATLVVPNGFFIGFWMHRVTTYYSEAGSADLVITDPRVFFQLLAWQTALVSAYSFFWMLVIYPRIRTCFVWWRKKDATL